MKESFYIRGWSVTRLVCPKHLVWRRGRQWGFSRVGTSRWVWQRGGWALAEFWWGWRQTTLRRGEGVGYWNRGLSEGKVFQWDYQRELGAGGVWRVRCSLSDLEVLKCGESNSGCEEGLCGWGDSEERKFSGNFVVRELRGHMGCLLQAWGPCLSISYGFSSNSVFFRSWKTITDTFFVRKLRKTVPPVLVILKPLPLAQLSFQFQTRLFTCDAHISEANWTWTPPVVSSCFGCLSSSTR